MFNEIACSLYGCISLCERTAGGFKAQFALLSDCSWEISTGMLMIVPKIKKHCHAGSVVAAYFTSLSV